MPNSVTALALVQEARWQLCLESRYSSSHLHQTDACRLACQDFLGGYWSVSLGSVSRVVVRLVS